MLTAAEFDTSYFIGNAPGQARLSGRDGDGDWFEVLPMTELQPDTRHLFLIGEDGPSRMPASTSTPGGACRGCGCSAGLTPEGLSRIRQSWDASA